MAQNFRVGATGLLTLTAKCYVSLGRWADAARTAGQLLSKSPPDRAWDKGMPHRFGVAIGAKAAMEMGDNDKAGLARSP